MSNENKTCDRCGREILNGERAELAAVDTYWCKECVEAWRNDPLREYEWARGAARHHIEEQGHPYTFERVGTEHGIAFRLTWWTPNLTAEEAARHLNFTGDPDEPVSWDQALAEMDEHDESGDSK